MESIRGILDTVGNTPLLRLVHVAKGIRPGSAVWAALKLAARIDADKNIVVILPDSGDRYLSKIYNDGWMRKKGFLKEADSDGI
jgi:cystathionine beta-synthase